MTPTTAATWVLAWAVALLWLAACGAGQQGSGPDSVGGDPDAATTRGADGAGSVRGDVVSLRPDDVGAGGAPDDALDTAGAAGGPDLGGPRPSCPPGATCALDAPQTCHYGVCNNAGACVSTQIPGCCTGDDDCAGVLPIHPCDVIACQSSVCTATRSPGCCAEATECDDGLACTEDVCTGIGGRCVLCPETCQCPLATPLFASGFAGGTLQGLGFTVSDEQPSDDVTWQVDDARFVRPPSAAYLGDPTCRTYFSGTLGPECQPLADDGARVRASLFTPSLALPDVPAGHVALWWVLADVEPPETGGPGEPDVLRVTVEPLANAESWPVTSTMDIGKSTSGAWRLMATDLSPWRGTSLQLRFTFDTLDGGDNHHEGVYLDELEVVPRCHGGCCETDADCADLPAGPCDTARCVALTDGGGAVCAVLPTAPGTLCQACASDAACEDDNPCTADTCGDGGTCSHASFCCFEAVVSQAGFEAGLQSWFVDDAQPADPVTWQWTDATAVEGERSAWLGDPTTGTYDSPDTDGDGEGERVRASLASAGVTMPPGPAPGDGAALAARFWLRLSTEWDGAALYDNPLGVDRLVLEVIAGPTQTEVWSSDDVGGSTGGLWMPIEVDLTPWADQGVQLRFTFDTMDGLANDFGGPHLDDLRIGRFCQ